MTRREDCEGMFGSSGYAKFIPACEGGNSTCENCPEEVLERFRGPKPPEQQQRIPGVDYNGVTGFVRIKPELWQSGLVTAEFPYMSAIWLPLREQFQHPRAKELYPTRGGNLHFYAVNRHTM